MAKKLINPGGLHDMSAFGTSQAVVDQESSLVFVSGQVAWDKQGQVSADSVPEQTKSALEHLHTVLQEAGSNVEGLLQIRIYIRGEVEDHFEALAPIMACFLGQSRPAVTAVGVASLASRATLVEIEATARLE